MGFGRSGIQDPPPAETTGQNLLDRVNAFGERHARAIIIVSTGLIILTVLIFAQVLWNRTLFDRVERDLSEAGSVESLEAIRRRYTGSAAEPRILATLGHRYAAEAKLEKAKEVYRDFLDKHQGHVLAAGVNRSLANVEDNLKFLKEQKAAKASEPLLSSHPIRAAKVADHPMRGGPVKEKHPMAVLKIKGKADEVRIELYEDEAPNAVAAFISLAEAKKFDGLTFAKIGESERLRLKPKDEEAWKDRLAFEPTGRDAGKGSLVLAREGGHNQTEFEILLKPAANSKEMTIFGRVAAESGPAGAQLLQNLDEKDEIESIKIESKRSHEYKPEFLK